MQDSFVPLIVSAGAFLAVLLWRVRPLVAWTTKQRESREALRIAQDRIAAAPQGPARAQALCDAADLLAKQVRGPGSAKALYLRAMRSDPKSADVIRRAVTGLSRRPRALESLLWRRLASTPWNESAEATEAALEALQALYEGPLRNAIRAKAFANARATLG
jgi:hypothetical protein